MRVNKARSGPPTKTRQGLEANFVRIKVFNGIRSEVIDKQVKITCGSLGIQTIQKLRLW